MIIPAILIGGGVAALLMVWLSASGEDLEEGEPAPPVPDPDLPGTAAASPAPAVPGAPSPAPAPRGRSSIPVVEREVEALARVVASEAGSGSPAEQRAIGWTARNRFHKRGSIYATEYPWREQWKDDPPFSSRQEARDAHRAIAREILLADQGEDPTGGATAFFEPRAQDLFAKAGEMARRGVTGDVRIDGQKLSKVERFKSYYKTADQVRHDWQYGKIAAKGKNKGKLVGGGDSLYARAGRFEFWGSSRALAQRGGRVQTIVGAGAPPPFGDIVDPLDVIAPVG